MFIVLVPYRARRDQQFRRNELISMLANVKQYFTKNNIEYKIIICEQNDNNKFNRGILLNIAFLEGEKLGSNKYFHMNTDYLFDLTRSFPNEILDFSNGFLDLHRPPYPVLGAACVFDSDSYKTINGFPNDLVGWGGDDWAIYYRILKKNICVLTPTNLFNSGFILETRYDFITDQSNNEKNQSLGLRDDIDTNGINSCNYTIDTFGEFNDGDTVFHFLVSI